MDKTTLSNRMKGYESASKTKLLRRTPVIIRIDGKAFHTWTKKLKHLDFSLTESPFSEAMHICMIDTTKALVNEIQNAVIGYTQSDEISILLNDWKNLETDQWFDGNIQKIASVSASIATAYFNRSFEKMFYSDKEYPALFDARVFNLPKEEVTNNFIWRQQDASRNSVQMLARYYFSHKELHKKNNSEIQDMLMKHYNINWNDLDTWKKRGTCVYPSGHVDERIPVFTQDREYIDRLLKIEE